MVVVVPYVVLHIGGAEEICAVAFGGVDRQLLHRILYVGRRCGLEICAVFVEHGYCRVHAECCVKHAVVAPFFFDLAGIERCGETQVVGKRVCRDGSASAKFFASAHDVESVGFLVVDRGRVVSAIGERAVDREILVGVIGGLASDHVIPVGACSVVVATACEPPFKGRQHFGLVLGKGEGCIRVICDHGMPDIADTLLGGDEDDAVGAACAVDGCGSSVLKH